MENNEFSIQNSSKSKEISETLPSNINQIINNPQKIEKNLEEIEENDELGYIPGNNYMGFNNFNSKKRLDSTDSPIRAKFSIDLPNVSKQRLHEYLNDDLLNALEYSPQIPTINNDLNNSQKNENITPDNNPNNLFGFSLYPSTQNNTSNNNINNIPEYYPNKQNFWNQRNIINNNTINSKFPNAINNKINYNNYNFNLNYYGMPNNNQNNIDNFNNIPMFIPKKLRNNEYPSKNISLMNEKNPISNNEKVILKNKFDNKKNVQNIKKEGKMKKSFEVRAGDWTCNNCSNLNFSFRSKCNRCGIPKDMSEKLVGELMNQKMNFNLNNDGRYE